MAKSGEKPCRSLRDHLAGGVLLGRMLCVGEVATGPIRFFASEGGSRQRGMESTGGVESKLRHVARRPTIELGKRDSVAVDGP